MKLVAAALSAFSLLFAVPGYAQKWPEKPVRLIVPYPPGGNVDTAARIVAPGMQQVLGQPFLVENKSGAGGMIAGEYVAKSDPDGYTLFFAANGPILFSPLIFGRSPYAWEKDFVPISTVSITSLVLQVKPSLPYATMGELIAAAKKEPGKLTMASPGAGTSNHLISELMQKTTGARWTTVHYKGNAPATADLLAGRVDFNLDQVSVALPHINQGRTRALAVTNDKRDAALPDVPTFQESGFKDFRAQTFTGVLAPKGTPPAVIAAMHAALAEVLAQEDVKKRFAGIGAEARAMTPAQFTAYLKREYATWTPVIKGAGIRAN